jgi:hypothetical protein
MAVVSNFAPHDLRVAIIIPTHNRWEAARETLARIEHRDYRNFQVVLIEDGRGLLSWSQLMLSFTGPKVGSSLL